MPPIRGVACWDTSRSLGLTRNQHPTGDHVAAEPTRRRVITAAAAALPLAAVSGCSGLKVVGTPPPPAADIVTLQAAIAAEQMMVDRYRTVLGSADSAASLASVLRPLLAEHVAHLSQLRSRLIVPAGSAASASPSPPARPAPTAPAAPAAAVAFLRSAEQAAAAAMLNRVLHAPASLAQLYASISASEATHVPVLSVALTAASDLPAASGGQAARRRSL